jgi:flagellar biosynthesis/type III secretory pathway protein FliH
LLAGLVRLALENIHSSTRVVVRIHPTQAASWREYFAQNIDPPDVPDIIEDPAVEAGRCILQTSVGTTQLGIEPQLKEIEQGLLDLLAQKPQTG